VTESSRFIEFKTALEAAQSEQEQLGVLEKFLADYVPYVRSLAGRLLSTEQRRRFDSEDIGQTIGWRLVERLRDGRIRLLTEGQFRQLLKTMVRNLLIDRGISRTHLSLHGNDDEQPLQLADSIATPSVQLGSEEARKVLRAEVERFLQPDEWYLFSKHFLEGEGYATAGAPFGLSADAARMRVNRIIEKLRKQLGDLGDLLE
jgi:RNA polymerase sigma factor (sigma-70 family)